MISLRRPTMELLLFTFDTSPLCDVAQTSDCGTLVIYFHISPLCDVAQTSDCGILAIYFRYKPFSRCRLDVRLWHAMLFTIQYKPFMWCRPDARLRHYYSCSFLSRSHSDPRLAPRIYFGISGGLPPDFSVIFPCIIISMSECTC